LDGGGAFFARARGEFSPPGDVDWYAVDVPYAGEYEVGVDLSPAWGVPAWSTVDPEWELYAPDRRFIQRSSNRGSSSESARIQLHDAGRYLLKVDNLAGSRSHARDTYALAVRRLGSGEGTDPNPFVRDRELPIDAYSQDTAIADVTGDGLPDALVVTGDERSYSEPDSFSLIVYPQTREGWLGAPRRYDTGVHEGDAQLATGDFTGDGWVDVAVTTQDGVTLYRQEPGRGLSDGQTQPGTAMAAHVEVADADGDGDRDVVYSALPGPYAPQGIYMLEQTDSEQLGYRKRLTPISVEDDFAVGRVNGDARPDLVLDSRPGSSGEVTMVLRRAADGTYAAQTLPYDADDIEIADFTGDGRQDVLLAEDHWSSGDLLLFAQGSGGGLGTLTRRIAADVFHLATADAEGDGDTDVAAGGTVYLQQPGGVLQRLPDASAPANADFAFGDLNGDGMADLASTNYYGLAVARRRSAGWPRPLWVLDAAPAPGATGVAGSAAPTVSFGRALDPSSITADTVALRDAATGQALAATRSYDAAARRVTVKPAAALASGRAYTVTVDGVKDAGGRVMGAGNGPTRLDDGEVRVPNWMVVEPFVLRFTAGPAPADTRSPETRLLSGPSGTRREATAHWEWVSDEQRGTFECSLDGGAFTDCETPYVESGTHTFRVRARDSAGNVDATPASRTWKVDPSRPATPYGSLGTAKTIVGSTGSLTGLLTGDPRGGEVGLPDAQNPGGDPHWYAWTAPANGTVTFDTSGSIADTLLGAARGESSYGNDQRIGDDDDGGSGRASRLTFSARAGQRYFVGVDGYNDTYDSFHFGGQEGNVANGSFKLAWTFTDSAAPVVYTGEPFEVRDRTARVTGEVDPNGSATSYKVEYGPTTAYGAATAPVGAGAGRGDVAVSPLISGLERGRTY
ncbi:MAG TPA: FG-GAP-like repeat-containing protein, partial [Solirubrobacteraceae bacterium]